MYPALLRVIITCFASNILLSVAVTVVFPSTSDDTGVNFSNFTLGVKWAGGGAAPKNADKIDDILGSSLIFV